MDAVITCGVVGATIQESTYDSGIVRVHHDVCITIVLLDQPYIDSSNAMDSTHPMSWPLPAQPSIRCQPANLFLTVKSTPKEDKVSTWSLGLWFGLGIREKVKCMDDRHIDQRARSFMTNLGT